MSELLFQNFQRIGIDEALAHQVSVSLGTDYNANKKMNYTFGGFLVTIFTVLGINLHLH
nr:hypothetical protein [Endozoicomonas sp.]